MAIEKSFLDLYLLTKAAEILPVKKISFKVWLASAVNKQKENRGYIPARSFNFYLNEFQDIEPYSPSVDIYGKYFKECESVSFGCKVLLAAFKNKEVAYALHKYKISLELSSFTPKSADPIYGQVFPNYDNKKESHTKAAFAIIATFSVIEELGVEIRSSLKKPRFLDHNKGIGTKRCVRRYTKKIG